MRRSQFKKLEGIDISLSRDIASQYDNVKLVADEIDKVAAIADNLPLLQATQDSLADLVLIGTEVVPNIAEILEADTNAATATAMAVTATTQAGLANTAKVAAEVAQGIAETKATEAGLSATAADASADSAEASAIIATTKAGEASASASAARGSELAAAAILDSFDDKYLGAYATDPTLNNDGKPLLDGALYYNTVNNVLKVYDVSNSMWYTIPQVQLSTLLDVQLTSVTTGDVLTWNGSKWINTSSVQEHITDMNNPHSVTKAQVGLGNVDNTSDTNKPISTATQNALDLKAPLASPALSGVPTAPTATAGTSTTQVATTAFVSNEIANDTYLKGTLDTNGTIMSKAAFNALAAERRANRAGSGFEILGTVVVA